MSNDPKSRHWRCRLFGHDYHPDAAEYYAIYDCQRCGVVEHAEPGLFPRLRWRFYLWRRDRAGALRGWWKCKYCGHHFGRHDETQDHLPF